jgi:hypothetical protein
MGLKQKLGRGEKKERRGDGPRGIGLGFVFFLFIFKSISNPFEFKSFTCFQIQILTQISPTILKAFHNHF